MFLRRAMGWAVLGLLAAWGLWAAPVKGPGREAKPEVSGRAAKAAFPSPLASGGPDAYGYRFVDSNEPGGPVFQWVDVSETGTPVFTGGEDDDNAFPVEIGFPFTFYGQTFTQAAVGTNGHVYFQDAYLGLSNVCIPGTPSYDVTENFIAAYWNDLVIEPGNVYTQTLGSAPNRRFVVQFQDVVFYDCEDTTEPNLSFEVILSEADGSILLQYLSAVDDCSYYDYGEDATVGIQRDPTLGLEYSCNTPSLSDNLAILFTLTPPFTPDLTFHDDRNRSELCIQRSNGMYQWTNADGSVFTGTGVVANGGTAFWTLQGDPNYIYATYDARRKRARSYWNNSETGGYNSLVDTNTTNNPACGSLSGP